MRKLLLMLFVLYSLTTFSQVGIGTTTPDPSSILELDSTTQGLLITRLTQVQRDQINAPSTGLLVFQTDNSPGFYYFDGTIWQPFGGFDNDWLGPGTADNTGFIYHQGTASVGRDNAIDDGLHFQVQDGDALSGTKVGLGSIEVIEDLIAEFTFNYGILPKFNNFADVGSATNRWRDLFMVNAPSVSSDMTLKQNVKSLSHGLNTLMQLETFSYQWNDETIGSTVIPPEEKETHLGFSAQQLLDVLPEVVKTHSWKVLDEANPDTFTRIKHDKLAVRYAEIIPVTVKAIQEQQNEIEKLKNDIEVLKKAIQQLSPE
ncbi:MAG: tail fiber domain-containing protein [Flavobacteriaceae bacterium]|nr:tail fiber domain-containing protein [Flavobacteriaceae bacterium]